FAYAGLLFALCNAFGQTLAGRRPIRLALASALAVLVGIAAWPTVARISAAALAAPARMRAFVSAPDDAYLSPGERRGRDRPRQLTRDDPCFFTFTSE